MKKVSVQFNLVVDDDWSQEKILGYLKLRIEHPFKGKVSNIQINNIESKRGKR